MNDNSAANRCYHDIISDYYERDIRQRVGLFSAAYAKRVERELRRFGSPDSRYLDLGTGTGNLLRTARSIFPHTVGMDISRKMLHHAARYRVPLVIGNNYRLPFRNACVDFLTASAVLHHTADLGAFFSEIHRVLKPGGRFYSDYDPNAESMALLHHHRLLRFLHQTWYRAILRARKNDVAPSDELRKAEFEAEHYIEREPGISLPALEQTLRDCAFRTIEIIPHSDCTDLDQPRTGRWFYKLYEFLLTILTGEREYRKLARIFAVRLVK